MAGGKATEPGVQTFPKGFPENMRRQLWPLCCGAAILSGFKKHVGETSEQITKAIEATMAELPDFQVYEGENMRPKLTMLTLNSSQTQSKTIMDAVTAAGFKLVFTAKPRGSTQAFFVRDDSQTIKLADVA